MTQNHHTQSENKKLKNQAKVFQSQIETNNQFYMTVYKRKSITKQTCIDNFSL